MRAAVGDRLHFRSKVVGRQEHTAVVVEARGKDGGPPYLVRHDDGHESLVYPRRRTCGSSTLRRHPQLTEPLSFPESSGFRR